MITHTEQPATVYHHIDHMHRFDLGDSFLLWFLVVVIVIKVFKD